MTTIAALVCLIISFFIGKNAIRITLIAGVFIAAGWAFDNITMGMEFPWTPIRKILVFAILGGAGWEFVRRVSGSFFKNHI